jgi:cytochrome c556
MRGGNNRRCAVLYRWQGNAEPCRAGDPAIHPVNDSYIVGGFFMKLLPKAAIATVLAGVFAGGVYAAVKPDDAIEYRQSVMQVVKWHFGPLGGMAKGEVPFDAALVKRNAERLQFVSALPLEGFGPGSDKGEKRETTAKATIWEDPDKFKSLMEKMGTESGKLADVAAGGDEGAVKAQIGEVAKVCKSCHDDFRVKK